MIDDDEPSSKHMAAAEELASLAAQAGSHGGHKAHAVLDRFRTILDDYREQSELLDPLLEQLVTPLAAVLRAVAADVEAAASLADCDLSGLRGASRLLWTLATTRGRKTVGRFLPNGAADLEPVLALLEHLRDQECMTVAEEGAEEGAWEARCVLLLWLAILVLVPFDLATIDSRESGGGRTLAQRLTDLCRSCLDAPGPEREVAALVLGRLLTRRDAGDLMDVFLAWTHTALEAPGQHAAFILPGVVATLAEVLKSGQRAQAAALARQQCSFVLSLSALPAVVASSLARRLLVKLITRMALALLPPAPAVWRRTSRVAALHATLAQSHTSGSDAAEAVPGSKAACAQGSSQAADCRQQSAAEPQHSSNGPAPSQPQQADVSEASGPVVHIPDEVEHITGELLQALRDPDTVVRWSAARGVGRVTGQLPAAAGAEVLDSVLQELDEAEALDEGTRHGCCLAIAELARRGLLPPARLQDVLPHITAALHYDVQRGAHSLGACVRDAAAYVCWAVSRSYAPDEVEPIVQQLAPALLTAAVLDREVACRRAAAAAFQEAVGRLGSFPNGIALLTAANYFTLSSRAQAYMQVAPQVAAYEAYRQPVADALLRVKLRHWDSALRALAADAAAQLVPLDPGFWAETAVPELRSAAFHSLLEVRHGALLGLAAVLPAPAAANRCASLGASLEAQEQSQLGGLVAAVEAARLLRGRGGELMRVALCRFVEGLALAHMPLNSVQSAQLLEFLDQQLAHPSDAVHEAAAAALHALTHAYWTGGQGLAPIHPDADVNEQRSFLMRCVKRLAAPQAAPEARRGAASALGVLPGSILQPAVQEVTTALAAAAVLQEGVSADDATAGVEARVAAVRALAAVVVAVCGQAPRSHAHRPVPESAEDGGLAHLLGRVVCDALLTAMDDYTTDNRGDVGSWVREAAMAGLTAVLPILCDVAPDTATSCTASTTAALAKQAVERIARMRQTAGKCLRTLLDHRPVLQDIPQRGALDAVLSDLGPDGCASLKALPAFAALLPDAQLRPALLQGLAMGLGGLDAQLAGASATAVVSALTRPAATGFGSGPMGRNGISTLPAGNAGKRQPRLVAEQVPELAQQPSARLQHRRSAGNVVDAVLLRAVLSDLPALGQHTERSSRMAMPLARLALLLLTECRAGRLWQDSRPASNLPAPELENCQRLQALVEMVKACGRGCGDGARLCVVGEGLCRLAGCASPVRDAALSGVFTLLASRLPRVRRHVAEQLYIELLAVPQHGSAAAARLPEALRVLAACCWDGDLDTAKAARQQLYPLLGVLPASQVKPMKSQQPNHSSVSTLHDSSYQQLVDTAARH